MGTCRLTAQSFVVIRLIVFTPRTLLNIYILLIPVTPEHWTNSSTAAWLATAADIWNGLPADMILQGEASGWRTILKDACAALYMRLTCTAVLYVYEFITEKSYLYQHNYLLLQQYSSLQVNLITFY